MPDQVYGVPKELVDAWRKKFAEEDHAQFKARVTDEGTLYRIPKDLISAWQKKYADDTTLDRKEFVELRRQVALELRADRIKKLQERGAVFDSDKRCWSLEGKHYDEDGNLT